MRQCMECYGVIRAGKYATVEVELGSPESGPTGRFYKESYHMAHLPERLKAYARIRRLRAYQPIAERRQRRHYSWAWQRVHEAARVQGFAAGYADYSFIG